MLHYYLQTWKKGRSFTGRARRKEYWIFQSGTVLLLIGVAFAFAWDFIGIVHGADEIRRSKQNFSAWRSEALSANKAIPKLGVFQDKTQFVNPNSSEIVQPTVNTVKNPRPFADYTIRIPPEVETFIPQLTDGVWQRAGIAFQAGVRNNPLMLAITDGYDSPVEFKPDPKYTDEVLIQDLEKAQAQYGLTDRDIVAVRNSYSSEEFNYILDKRLDMRIGHNAQMLNEGAAFLARPYSILVLLIMIVSVAVGVRRLHDVGKSGWFILIGLVPIVNVYVFYLMLIKKGDVGDNQYGPDPKTED